MNKFINVLMFLGIILGVQFNSFAQIEVITPYNPDVNGDSLIGLPDLLHILPLYGQEFNAESINIDSLCGLNNSFSNTKNVCLIGNGPASGGANWYFYLGTHNCSTVLYNKLTEQSRAKVMRLPVTGNYEGREIHFVGTSTSWQQGQPIRIEYFENGAWTVLAELPYNADQRALGEQWSWLHYVKAVFTNDQWTWIQGESIEVPYNQNFE